MAAANSRRRPISICSSCAPTRQTAFDESVTEYMLYMLWDMGLKVGHSSRNIDECLKLAREDHTIQTALLEARRIAGDESLASELFTRFRKDVADRDHAAFITAKLTERDERHARAGASRYMVEPNIKEGKGGLRDSAHALLARAPAATDFRARAITSKQACSPIEERNAFRRALEFLWTVRCHLHFITGRAEERLTFDLQPELAKRLGYGARANHSAVERFMKRYFLVAKEVGALTRTLCARLEADNAKQSPKGLQRFLSSGRKRVAQIEAGFVVEAGRLNIENESVLETPANALRLFAIAEKLDLDIHPDAFGQARAAHVRSAQAGASCQRRASRFLMSPRQSVTQALLCA
jgi:[protein-PII] uridylyltransferase